MRWAKKWWSLIAVLAIALVIWREEKNCQTQSYQCRASYAAQARSERLSGGIPVYQQASEQQAIAAACEPDTYFCRLFSATNLPTILLVLVGIGGIWAALRTLSVLQAQTRAALTSAMAAHESIELVKSKEKPRIHIKVRPLSLTVVKEGELGTNEITYHVHVLCPTPAFIIDSSVEARITDSLEPPAGPFYGKIDLPDIIPDAQKLFECRAFLFDANTEAEIRDINTSKKFVYFQACIKFRDVFSIGDEANEVSVRCFWKSQEGFKLFSRSDGEPFYTGEWVSVPKDEQKNEEEAN